MTVQASLCLTWLETQIVGFSCEGPFTKLIEVTTLFLFNIMKYINDNTKIFLFNIVENETYC